MVSVGSAIQLLEEVPPELVEEVLVDDVLVELVLDVLVELVVAVDPLLVDVEPSSPPQAVTAVKPPALARIASARRRPMIFSPIVFRS